MGGGGMETQCWTLCVLQSEFENEVVLTLLFVFIVSSFLPSSVAPCEHMTLSLQANRR